MTNETIQQLVDIEAIKQLKGSYCRCVAIEDWDTFFTLFTEDLEFITPGDGKVHTPCSEFYAMHKANLQDPKVWGMEDVHIYPGTDPHVGHHGYGFYHEDYVRTPAGWKFKRIEVRYDRMDPLEGGFGPGYPD